MIIVYPVNKLSHFISFSEADIYFKSYFKMEESKSVLEREWFAIYKSKDAKFVLVGNV